MATSPVVDGDQFTRRIEAHLDQVAHDLGPAPARSVMSLEHGSRSSVPVVSRSTLRTRARIGLAAGLAVAVVAVGVAGLVLRQQDRTTVVSEQVRNRDLRLWPTGRTDVEKSILPAPSPGITWTGIWGDRDLSVDLMVQPVLRWEPPGTLDEVLAGGAEPVERGEGWILQWSDLKAKRTIWLVARGRKSKSIDLAAIARGISITDNKDAGGGADIRLAVEPLLPRRYFGDISKLEAIRLWSITGGRFDDPPVFILDASVPSETAEQLAKYGPEVVEDKLVMVGTRSVTMLSGNEAARQARWSEDGIDLYLTLFKSDSDQDLIDFIGSLERITPAEFDRRLGG
jgi:hypothetical protein